MATDKLPLSQRPEALRTRHRYRGADLRKETNQVGILFVDDTNLWAGLGEDDDVDSTMAKGKEAINSWGNNLLAVGGELRPDKCSYTVDEMRPTGDGEWRYVQEVVNKTPPAVVQADQEGVDELWEINAEAENQETSTAKIIVPLIDGDAAAIKETLCQRI